MNQFDRLVASWVASLLEGDAAVKASIRVRGNAIVLGHAVE